MPLSFDLERWPIAVCRAYGESTDDDLRAYTGRLSELLAREQRHVLIVDASGAKTLKGTHRQMVAEWNKANAEKLAKYRVGLVLVTRSAVLRGMITAVYWVFTPPFPYKAVDSIDSAFVWARERLTS